MNLTSTIVEGYLYVPSPGLRAAPTARLTHVNGQGVLSDKHGRVMTDLRVSLTDRCNLRCSYCMPAEGLAWLPHENHLTDDEVLRLLTIATTRLGVTSVRFTGGEPLLRRGLVDLVRRTKELGVEVSLTTNGIGLAKLAGSLAEAGLDRVNVSLDTVRAETFKEITRRDRLHDVIDGLAASYDVGLGPVKVNAVLLRGVNDDQAGELLDWCLERDYRLRFIEQMPLEAQGNWTRDQMVSADEILEQLRLTHRIDVDEAPRGSAPSQTHLVDGGPGTVGLIASVTRPFCGDCDRIRLTSDGQLRNCLFARIESDLRSSLRGGSTDSEIADQWIACAAAKKPGHGIDEPGFLRPARPMSAIGG